MRMLSRFQKDSLKRSTPFQKSYLEDGDMMRKLDIIMDEFQDMVKKGEIAWSE